MRGLSPGWATDLAILELTGSTVDDQGDHLVVRSPGNPDYHWGNCLLVTDPATIDDAVRWSDAFGSAFPHADWVTIGLPGMPRNADAWTALGIELELVDVLSTTRVPRTGPLAEGYTVRQIVGPDWDLVIGRELADNARTGVYDATRHERFVRATAATREDLSTRGLAAFFGAFAGAELVADLGVVRCGSTARFQAVSTDPAHRRRGLAAHLLGVAAHWAAGEGCDAWVIVTESTNDAGRVYRAAGFAPDDPVVSAYRPPDHA
jgi:GNAT superfamily N-acetyltransferase